MSDHAPAPPSRRTAVKIVLSVVAIGGAIALFLTASIGTGAEYYKFVDEVMANPDAFRGKHLQVHGLVVGDSIEQAKGTLRYRFKIHSIKERPPAEIVATYEGLVPDTFKAGADVILKGTLTADNQVAVFPDGILAKCPTKYKVDEMQQQKPSGSVAQQLKL